MLPRRPRIRDDLSSLPTLPHSERKYHHICRPAARSAQGRVPETDDIHEGRAAAALGGADPLALSFVQFLAVAAAHRERQGAQT